MQFVNNVDPITLESIEDILPDNLIRLKIGEKLRFYNIQALYKWMQIDPIDPITKIPFSRCQINKIKRVYSKSTYQNIEKFISNFYKENRDELNKFRDIDLSLFKDVDIRECIQKTDFQTTIKNNPRILDSINVKEMLNDDEFKNIAANMYGMQPDELNPIFKRLSENSDIFTKLVKNLGNSLSE